MAAWLDTGWLRLVGYLAAALTAVIAGWREHKHTNVEPDLWPSFWFLTAGLFAAMAVGRATDLGYLATQLGRSQARSQGWYVNRRKAQALVVGSLGALWWIAIVVAVWRVPQRRRRYLPAAIAAFTLLCFAAIRLVSLHQIDAVLYRRHIAGARVGVLVEVCLLVAAVTVAWRHPLLSRRTQPPSESTHVGAEQHR